MQEHRIRPIGHVRSPLKSVENAPPQGDEGAPDAWIELREDVLQMIATNVRHPRDFRGDLAAMIGSARVGERRMQALRLASSASCYTTGTERPPSAASWVCFP